MPMQVPVIEQAEERWAAPDPEVVLETGTTVELVFQVILPDPNPNPNPNTNPNPNPHPNPNP